MTLQRFNMRVFHRRLYAGLLWTVTLLKRGDDLQQGTVRAITLYQCRPGQITYTGNTLQGTMNADDRLTWHIPDVELARVGVHHITSLDRIVDKYDRYWQPESPTTVLSKLLGNHLCVNCLRVDPPSPNQLRGLNELRRPPQP